MPRNYGRLCGALMGIAAHYGSADLGIPLCFRMLAKKNNLSYIEPGPLATTSFTYRDVAYPIPPELLPSAEFIANYPKLADKAKRELLAELSKMFTPPHDRGAEHATDFFAGEEDIKILNEALALKKPSPKRSTPGRPRAVTIITHQVRAWQDSAARFVRNDPLLKDVPTILLHADSYPVTSREFLDIADEIRHSGGGRIGEIAPDTEEVNLMGGFCGLCLTSTIESVVNQLAFTNMDRPLNFYIYAGETYTGEHENIAAAMSQDGALPPPVKSFFRIDGFNFNDKAFPIKGNEFEPIHENRVDTPYGPGIQITLKSKVVKHRPITITVLAK